MSAKERHSFSSDFRTFFVKGLAILLPSVLTLWIVAQLFMFMQTRVAEPINTGVRFLVIETAPRVLSEAHQPGWLVVGEDQVLAERTERERKALRTLSDEELRTQIRERNLKDYWDGHWYLRSIGLVVAIVLIYLAGRLLGGYIGRRVYTKLERYFARLPIVKQVYPHVKQVVEFIFGERDKIKFNRVVLVEYPRKDIWTIGLLTGESMRDIENNAGEECVSVFIPSSPAPFTGYTITLKKKDTIDLPISVEEALRFVVTGGVLIPEGQQAKNGVRQIQPGPKQPTELADADKTAKIGSGADDSTPQTPAAGP